MTVVLNCGVYAWLFTQSGAEILQMAVDAVRVLGAEFVQFWSEMLI